MKLKAVECVKNGKKMWRVNVPLSVAGQRHRSFGETKEAALESAQLWIGERRQFGAQLAEVTMQERAFLSRWRSRLTLERMEQILQADIAMTGCSKPVADAWAEYLVELSQYSKDYLSPLISRGKKICAHWQGETLEKVSGGKLFDFVRSQGNSEPDYYKAIRAWLNWCVLKNWIKENPVLKFKPRRSNPADNEIAQAAKMREILKFLVTAPIAPDGVHEAPAGTLPSEEMRGVMLRYVVMGAFAGLRTSEIQRLKCDAIGDEIFVQKLKTQKHGMRARFVEILPVLNEWLQFLKVPKKGAYLDVNESNFSKHRSALAHLVGWENWPENVLRNSFASYHLKAYENPGKTAVMLGHTSAETTASKYQVPCTKAEALKYFEIRPQTV